MAEQMTNTPQADVGDILKIRRDKLTALQAAGADPFAQTRFDWDATSQQIRDNFDAMEGKPVKVAGRLMSKRGMREHCESLNAAAAAAVLLWEMAR